MNQRDFKKQIIADLLKMGYLISDDQFVKCIGIFNVIIHLSNRPSVLIETSGIGKYYIVLHKKNLGSYSDTNAEEISKEFNTMVLMCNNFYTV